MKAIILDIDGVVIKSDKRKHDAIVSCLKEHNLYNIPQVKEIYSLGLNRKILLDKIEELVSFDKVKVLESINEKNSIIESSPVANNKVVNFIKNNYDNYILTTNTSLPMESLVNILDGLGIKAYFKELLAYETGSKIENINFVLKKYNLKGEDVLFVDDNINFIDIGEEGGVKTLHYTDYDMDISNYL